jgi:Cu/Zn superoxide dismutase
MARVTEISLRSIVAAVLAILICGCTYSGGSARLTHGDSDDAQPKASPNAGLTATMRPVGSAVAGKVRVIDRGDGVSVMLSTNNLFQGGVYRMAFHRDGNCTSPNAFSAGPAWAPPGMNPATLIPTFLQRIDGSAEVEVHVSGVHTQGENGLAGRSIVLYAGDTIPEIKPGMPNNALACGVFEPVRPLMF